MEKALSTEEFDERVAILRRFRMLLETQRNTFREYLTVLEKQQLKIEADDSEALMAHAELETQIVANISNLQKVIKPLQLMYESNNAATTVATAVTKQEDADVEKMQLELAELQQRVLAQNEHNRMLLKAQLSRLRTQLTDLSLKNPYRGRRSVYAEKVGTGSMLAVEA